MTDNILNLKNLSAIESFSSRFSRLGDLYILSHVKAERPKDENGKVSVPGLHIPLKLDGLLLLTMQTGSLHLRVNSDIFEVKSDHIIAVSPGTLITITDVETPVEFTILFISSTFLRSINIDLNSIDIKSIMDRPKPILRLTEQENEVVHKYFELLDLNAESEPESVFAKRVARMLISSIAYEMLRFATSRTTQDIENYRPASVSDFPGRAQNYVYRFMQLLQVHYASQRNLDFYAHELCITPKYLTMVTKEVTGRTASELLNRVVITEAKNLLCFSGKSVQQVAYDLNFPSQSAFGKYFKRITGQSPTSFLRSI